MALTLNADDEGEDGNEVDGGVIASVDEPPVLLHGVPPLPGLDGGVQQGLHQLLAFRLVITNHL